MNMSKIIIGAMRFPNRATAVATVRRAIDCGFNYVDCSPCYCFQSEEENSESWVGEAVNHPHYRNRVMISAKCTPGNGGLGFGEYNPATGFGVRTAPHLREVFDQSRKRINVDRFDYYHLWTTHTLEQLADALKPGGWYEGLEGLRSSWDHHGFTTHADSATIIAFLKTGKFETVTLPLNVINTTRLEAVRYCQEHHIPVIAMNPFAGGLLTNHERLKELALRYLMSLDGVHLLIGFASEAEVEYAKWIEDSQPTMGMSPEAILAEVATLIDAKEPRCTACGYCQPCPENINVGASLSYYNLFQYMGLQHARKAFIDKQWEDGLKLDKCKACGLCASRCPNGLPVVDSIAKARKVMYDAK